MSGGIEINKIAGSVFLAGIIAMVAGLMAQGLYTGSISDHEEHHAKRGYSIEVPEGGEESAGGAVDDGPVDIAQYLGSANVAAGEAMLKKCTTCHSFDKGGKNGVGPNQWNLVGRKIASAAGYAYSDALKGMSAKTWTFQDLSEFLHKPKQYAPGNKMSFAGIKKPEERANLLAYLNTLSDSPLPLPEAKPVEKPTEENSIEGAVEKAPAVKAVTPGH